jgi:hypothetical protein
MLFLDEAFAEKDGDDGRLKALVTEPTIMIEPKYIGPFPIRNMLKIIMASNKDWVVPAGLRARRWMVLDVSEARIGDKKWFREIKEEQDDGGTGAFLHDMLNLPLGEWHPRDIVQTPALIDQKQHSLTGLMRWIEHMLQLGALPVPLSQQYPNRCTSAELLRDAKNFYRYANETEIAILLRKVLGCKPFGGGARGWAFPDLPEARRLFEEKVGGKWYWHHSDIREWALPADDEDEGEDDWLSPRERRQQAMYAAIQKERAAKERAVKQRDEDEPGAEPRLSIAAILASPIASATEPAKEAPATLHSLVANAKPQNVVPLQRPWRRF